MLKLFAFWLAVVPVSVAHATSMVVMDVPQQADESHGLVDAVVGQSWVVQTERMVYTHTELQVRDVLGGDTPRSLILRQAGGELEGRTVFIAGDAKLREGERIVAFVRERQGLWYLTALGQSVWHVEEGRLTQAIEAEHLLERDYDGRVVPATQSPQAYDTVTDLARAAARLDFGGAL